MKFLLTAILMASNTVLWTCALYLNLVGKLLSPFKSIQLFFHQQMVQIAQTWIAGNTWILQKVHKIEWSAQGIDKLNTTGSYLICSNHQSWVDIIVLQKVFNYKIPFIRFFIKSSLIYVPLLGAAWWALDFPFMKRFSKEYLQKHPEKRGQDLLSTKKMCDKLKGKNVSVLNFLEGTRFTQTKHAQQNSPFKHLLKPKSGGLAYVIETMGEQFQSLLDVTIYYPDGASTFGGLLMGKAKRAQVIVNEIKIPAHFLNKSYLDDAKYRDEFQNWVQEIWEQKDKTLDALAGS